MTPKITAAQMRAVASAVPTFAPYFEAGADAMEAEEALRQKDDARAKNAEADRLVAQAEIERLRGLLREARVHVARDLLDATDYPARAEVLARIDAALSGEVRVLNRLLDFAESAPLTDAEVRAELEADGVDVEAVTERGLARIREARAALSGEGERVVDEEEPAPMPTGHCPRCLAPWYGSEGFCGGCE